MENLSKLTKRKFNIINIADEIGISKAAELFNIDRGTIRNWLKQFSNDGLKGLQNKSRVDQNFSNKIPNSTLKKILKLKIEHPEYTAKKIIDVLKLKYSISTI